MLVKLWMSLSLSQAKNKVGKLNSIFEVAIVLIKQKRRKSLNCWKMILKKNIVYCLEMNRKIVEKIKNH